MKGDYYYRGATTTVEEHSYSRSEVLRIEGYNSKHYDISVARSVVSDSATPWTDRMELAKPFCPWDSPAKNTGVGCHAFLQL